MEQALKVIKFDSDENLDEGKKSKRNSGSKLEYYLVPLRTAAIITAILGVISLVLEVRIYFQFRYEIYLARLVPTLFSLVTLILLQTKFAKKNHVLISHFYLAITLASLSFVGLKIPSLFGYYLLGASIFTLTLSLYFYWGRINQIIALTYFVVIFGASAFSANLFSDFQESNGLIFITSLSLLIISVIASNLRTVKKYKSAVNLNLDEVAENEEFNQGYFNNSIIPLFQINLNGEFEYANSTLKDILCLSNENEINEYNYFDDIVNNEKVKNHILKKIESKGRVENFRFTYSKKDGTDEILLMDCKTKSINDEIYLEGSLRNITLQFEKDKAIRKEIEVLKQNKRQTSNIIPSFSDKNSNKSTIISKMGHALRTPMNSVLGFLTLIENGLFENELELKEFSHSAKLSAESLLGLLNDVVEIAKIQDGTVELSENEFNIKDDIEKITSELAPQLKPHDLKITNIISEDVPNLIKADQFKFSKILTNLLRNAIQASEEGEIQLSLSAKMKDNGLHLITSVTDSSKGLSEIELKNLLEKDLLDTESISSSVLHILICKEMLELIGGKLHGSSEEGEGTRFTFEINIESISNSEIIAEEAEDNEIVDINDGSKPKLLLVEDNPISRKVEQKLLQEAGYAVDCVDNGTDSIEKVKNGNYNLVLMDIELKDMNGLEATKQIRQLPDGLSDIPIIAVTAHSSMKDREKCLVAGMNDYISKPINITFLKMTIDQWLNEARAK